ncbi:MAG TPA: hypothetical protein VHT75_14470 [Acidimicrobiales bacterium]|nr:hypothetical protein [Acidimicrobiales bacterium]
MPGETCVYVNRRRQWLYVIGIVGVYLSTVGMVFEKDPSTGIKPLPGDYLWVVIPGTIMVAVLAWRALKARIETDNRGIRVVRTVGQEFIPWSDIRGFEVHPTPSRQGSAVLVRRPDETLFTVRSEVNIRPVFPLRDRQEAKLRARGRAQLLHDALEADRRSRLAPATSP